MSITATLVRDGHGLLAGRVRWRRVDGAGSRKWHSVPLDVEHSGAATATIVPEQPGSYEFEVQAWQDRFATWRRDLQLRAVAGYDLSV